MKKKITILAFISFLIIVIDRVFKILVTMNIVLVKVKVLENVNGKLLILKV